MKTGRLGCLSGSGIIATLITLLVLGGVGYARGNRMFNPGPLNDQAGAQPLGGVRSHAEIGGRCSACHTAVWESETMSDRCLLCHQELTTNPQDFHKAMLAQSQTSACYECHTEHRGAQAALTVMDLSLFPHDTAGYSLKGHQITNSGADFTCSDCHGDQIGAMDLGVCADCHQQIDPEYMADHLAAFGRDCLVCHDGVDTYGKVFDHNRQAFPLQGIHAQTACAGCHDGARTIADLQNTPQDCFACHRAEDSHQGRFGQDCAQCHSPAGWGEATFDHTLAAFQLNGAHVDVPCEACHQGGVFQGTPQECYACHEQDDAHAGQFGQDCAQCHTTEGWQGATFDHSLAAFQLTGVHIHVPCAECHVGGIFRGTPQECSACHAEPGYHLGLFGSDCVACHDTTAWVPALFDRSHTFPFNHGESGFSDCRVCHPTSLSGYDCYTCHEHNPAQIEAKHREEGIANFQDCVACHPTGREEESEGRGGDD